jgi:hypothetical protein
MQDRDKRDSSTSATFNFKNARAPAIARFCVESNRSQARWLVPATSAFRRA